MGFNIDFEPLGRALVGFGDSRHLKQVSEYNQRQQQLINRLSAIRAISDPEAKERALKDLEGLAQSWGIEDPAILSQIQQAKSAVDKTDIIYSNIPQPGDRQLGALGTGPQRMSSPTSANLNLTGSSGIGDVYGSLGQTLINNADPINARNYPDYATQLRARINSDTDWNQSVLDTYASAQSGESLGLLPAGEQQAAAEAYERGDGRALMSILGRLNKAGDMQFQQTVENQGSAFVEEREIKQKDWKWKQDYLQAQRVQMANMRGGGSGGSGTKRSSVLKNLNQSNNQIITQWNLANEGLRTVQQQIMVGDTAEIYNRYAAHLNKEGIGGSNYGYDHQAMEVLAQNEYGKDLFTLTVEERGKVIDSYLNEVDAQMRDRGEIPDDKFLDNSYNILNANMVSMLNDINQDEWLMIKQDVQDIIFYGEQVENNRIVFNKNNGVLALEGVIGIMTGGMTSTQEGTNTVNLNVSIGTDKGGNPVPLWVALSDDVEEYLNIQSALEADKLSPEERYKLLNRREELAEEVGEKVDSVDAVLTVVPPTPIKQVFNPQQQGEIPSNIQDPYSWETAPENIHKVAQSLAESTKDQPVDMIGQAKQKLEEQVQNEGAPFVAKEVTHYLTSLTFEQIKILKSTNGRDDGTGMTASDHAAIINETIKAAGLDGKYPQDFNTRRGSLRNEIFKQLNMYVDPLVKDQED